MSTRNKLIIIASSLVGAGLVFAVIALLMVDFDFTRLGTEKYVTNEYTFSESFKNISINGDTEDITFVRSDDATCKVVCYEDESELHDVNVRTDTLTIEEKKSRMWHFGISTHKPTITVYLPDRDYGTIVIHTDTGDTKMSDVQCQDYYSECDTGSLFLKNVIASGSYHFQLDTGDVHFDRCDAKEIYIETDTGDIDGTLLTDKVFLTDTDTGDVNVPKAVSGGRCEITTDTGDITIQVP